MDDTRWIEIPIECPYCGNHGEADGHWRRNASQPFRLIEEVKRLWFFSAELDARGGLSLVGDTDSDEVDWESGANLRLACMQCFGEFPIPEIAVIDFE